MTSKTPDYNYLEECLREQLVMFLEDKEPKLFELIAGLATVEGYDKVNMHKTKVDAIYWALRDFIDEFKFNVESVKQTTPAEVE